MTPLKKRLIVKEIPVEKIGSIFIPEMKKGNMGGPSHTGTVIAVGPEVTDIKAGDTIVFSRYSSILTIEDKIVINEDDVLGIMED